MNLINRITTVDIETEDSEFVEPRDDEREIDVDLINGSIRMYFTESPHLTVCPINDPHFIEQDGPDAGAYLQIAGDDWHLYVYPDGQVVGPIKNTRRPRSMAEACSQMADTLVLLEGAVAKLKTKEEA